MKKLKLVLVVMIATVVAAQAQTKKEVLLDKEKVYEVAYASVIPDKMQQLVEDYFPDAGSIVSNYGGKSLASFTVVDLKKGGLIDKPDMLVLFEWPSIEQYKKAMKDKRLRKIMPIRNAAFSQFGQAFFKVGESTTVTFHQDKSYEFFFAWLKPDGQKPLGEYFQISDPIKKSYGRPEPIFKANLSPVENAPKEKSVLVPHMGGIVEWDSYKDPDVLSANADFVRKAIPKFELAVERIEMIHGSINLE